MRWPVRTPAAPRRPAGRPLFLFRSSQTSGLNAFTASDDPGVLPQAHQPWVSVGNVPAGQALPHGLSRRAAEQAIEGQGFALWRMKPETNKS
jgi:hypothetical protein